MGNPSPSSHVMGVSKNNGFSPPKIIHGLIGKTPSFSPYILGGVSPYFWFNTHIFGKAGKTWGHLTNPHVVSPRNPSGER